MSDLTKKQIEAIETRKIRKVRQQTIKPRLINQLITHKIIDEGENTRKFVESLPFREVCEPLIIRDHQTGKYSYQQLANKYWLTYAQIRNIVSK